MTAIPDLSTLINLQTGGGGGAPETLFVQKLARLGTTAILTASLYLPVSMWRAEGVPGAGAVPPSGAGEAPTRATPGAIPFTNAAAGKQKWLLGIGALGTTAGAPVLYDRLAHTSGLSGTVTTAQTVNTPALTRYGGASAKGNIVFLEINTQIGATAVTASVSYTNQDGTAGRTGTVTTFGGSGNRDPAHSRFMALQSGDTGVRSVESVTLSATTGTAGDFGVVIARPLVTASVAYNGEFNARDLISGLPGITEIVSDSCLALLWLPGDTAAAHVYAELQMVEY